MKQVHEHRTYQPAWTVILLSIPLLPIIQGLLGSGTINDFEFYVSIFIQIYISFRASYLSASGRLTTARVFIFSFYYVSSGLAVEISFITKYHSGLDYYVNLSQFDKALLLSFISLLILDFALPGTEVQIQKSELSNIDSRRIRKYIILALLLLIQYLVATGIGAILSSRESVSRNLAGGSIVSENIALSGLYVSATKIFPLIVTAYALILRDTFTRKFKGIVYLNLVLLTIINNPISTPRYQFAIFVVVIGYSFILSKTNRNMLHLVSLILLVVVVFPTLDFGRTNERTAGRYSISTSFEKLAQKDFDQVLMGALTLSTANENPKIFPLGKQILGEIGAFIPRSIWKQKPLDASIPVARHFNLANENLSVPLWAEGYLSLRYLGVCIFPFLLGMTFRRIANARNSIHYYVLQSFLLGSVFIILRGTLMQYMGLFFAAILSILLINRNLVVAERRDS